MAGSRQTCAKALLAALAAILLAGCDTLAYYAQALGGQMSLMSRARPVGELMADPATPPELRERLALTRSIRDFATQALKLPDNGSYRSFAQVDRSYAVWNVVAAPEFSLEPLQSCFPVAGCVTYRGFFALEDAAQHGAQLLSQGYDVYVYGVPAYSTLGRFDDPLLSTFIGYRETELARLIFHELAHQVLYVRDDTTFNESFAVTVEREGVRRWLAASGRAEQLAEFFESQRRRAEFFALLSRTRERLDALYRLPIAPEAMRERKRAEFNTLRLQLPRTGPQGQASRQEPNNATLASYATYTALVPAFERLLQQEGGDLERFYDRVRALARAGARPS